MAIDGLITPAVMEQIHAGIMTTRWRLAVNTNMHFHLGFTSESSVPAAELSGLDETSSRKEVFTIPEATGGSRKYTGD
ncbi:hypothetical protein V490_04663 [Pseudogymnoascus sp. VKM F-3557]|nr:hypothetical protein V490_04663 [Pseudogymnoascus sp. VKM F-3557]